MGVQVKILEFAPMISVGGIDIVFLLFLFFLFYNFNKTLMVSKKKKNLMIII